MRRRWGWLIALAAVLIVAFPADVPVEAQSVDLSGPALVDLAADHYGLEPWARAQAHRVIDCESGYRNIGNYQGSGAAGPAQFMPSTFNANKAAAGFPGASVWDVRANIFTAVYMMGRGWWSHWNASRGCWGRW